MIFNRLFNIAYGHGNYVTLYIYITELIISINCDKYRRRTTAYDQLRLFLVGNKFKFQFENWIWHSYLVQ